MRRRASTRDERPARRVKSAIAIAEAPPLEGRRRTRPGSWSASGGPSAAAHRRRPCSSDPFSDSALIVGLYLAPRSCPGSCVDAPDPGPGPFPSPLADAPRAGGAAQPRLQAHGIDLSLRGPRHRHGRIIGKCFILPADLDPHRHGQLRDPQDQGDPRLVRQTAALAGPFHTHQRLLAEPGRALVRAADRQADQARRPSLHQGVGAHHPRLHRPATNQNPKPFKWTKSADDILGAIQRFCLRTIEIAEQQAKIMRTSESGH